MENFSATTHLARAGRDDVAQFQVVVRATRRPAANARRARTPSIKNFA